MRIEKSQRMRLRDVLVLTLADVAKEEEVLVSELGENLQSVCNIPVIIIRETMALESFSEADMLRAGWMRTERRSNGGNGHRESSPAVTDTY